ncbi:hypothetical protein GcC1_058018 [Golovinomyces cichoracearum]|uniref:Uncharacterized protein n=1 Tax=Golovinomyces cichoracearum TaxID=62708 RepID=A0A420IU70_9PEZI|nr:hypothetical protein GcC1_058018 [Golovinomyces cichoracearum]
MSPRLGFSRVKGYRIKETERERNRELDPKWQLIDNNHASQRDYDACWITDGAAAPSSRRANVPLILSHKTASNQ